MVKIFNYFSKYNSQNINSDVLKIYNKYKDNCQVYFGVDIYNMSGLDDEKKYYVYAWYTKTNPKKYFYIGKGVGDRYKHILREADKVTEYRLLQSKYGIDHEILLDNLSEKEALVYEFCIKCEMSNNGEVILDNEGVSLNSIEEETAILVERQKPGARIEVDPFIDRYLSHKYKLAFDPVKKEFLKTVYFYPYFFNDDNKSIEKRELASSYIIDLGGKINKSLTDKTQGVVIQGRLPEKKFISLKDNGKEVYNIDDILKINK